MEKRITQPLIGRWIASEEEDRHRSLGDEDQRCTQTAHRRAEGAHADLGVGQEVIGQRTREVKICNLLMMSSANDDVLS